MIEYLLRDATTNGPIGNEYQPSFQQYQFNRAGKNAFEKCKQIVLQNEIVRVFTQKRLAEAREYFDGLTDERIGRLFRVSDNIEISSITGNPDLAFKMSERDYSAKSEIFSEFLNDLYQTNCEYVRHNDNV